MNINRYVIKKVSPKEGTKHNPIHGKLTNRPCYFFYIEIGERALISYQPEDEPVEYHTLYTSPVQSYTEHDDGSVAIETQNTIYTFEKLNKGVIDRLSGLFKGDDEFGLSR